MLIRKVERCRASDDSTRSFRYEQRALPLGAGLAYLPFLVAGAQHLPLLAPLEFVAHRFQLLGLEIVARTAEAGVFLLVDVMVDEVFEHLKLGDPGIAHRVAHARKLLHLLLDQPCSLVPSSAKR